MPLYRIYRSHITVHLIHSSIKRNVIWLRYMAVAKQDKMKLEATKM